MFKLKILTALSLLVFSSYFVPAHSANKKFSIDELFKSADLMKLINTKQAVNLQAQLSDPKASTAYVSDLNEFVARGVLFDQYDVGSTFVTQFDMDQTILHKIQYPVPWIGVQEFTQSELPTVSLQEGLELVKSCMAGKKEFISDQITRVTIYKTIQSGQMIYDYVFKDSMLRPDLCQEVLYVPKTGDCEKGMIIKCHIDMPSEVKVIK